MKPGFSRLSPRDGWDRDDGRDKNQIDDVGDDFPKKKPTDDVVECLRLFLHFSRLSFVCLR